LGRVLVSRVGKQLFFFYIKPNKQLLTLKKNNVLFMRWESQNPGSVGRALAWVGEKKLSDSVP
jgi:hypothetical protein